MAYRIQSTEPEFLIDVGAINTRLAGQRADPRRWFTGSFRVPKECSRSQLNNVARDSANRWIEVMRKKRWDLIGKVFMYGPRTAHDIDTNAVILDRDEMLLKAVFQLADTPKPERLEVPTGLIKRDPEHTITAAAAKRALA